MVATSLSGTGWSAFSAAIALAAPSGSTPIILMLGFFNLAAAAIPETIPPPPTGTSNTSASGNSSKTSNAIVPCPSITSSSSKG